MCPYDECRVVLLGQDPYPQKGVATGLAFGNKIGTVKISPSLQVLKESVIDYTKYHSNPKFDITLEDWAKQGVLLLNSALTVEVNKPQSHTLLWRPFIADLLNKLSNYRSGIVYILLGKQAQSFKPYINSKFNYILEEQHPSYFIRTNQTMPNTVFKEASRILNDINGYGINWYYEEEEQQKDQKCHINNQ